MRPGPEAGTGVVILAGGEATRLPGKLELDAGGLPLILRVLQNVRAAGPVYVSANRSFPPEIDMALHCPIVIDRLPGRGPLSGLLSTLPYVREPWVFVAAGDAPGISAAVAAELSAAWEPGDEAIVPQNAAGRLEPLCALYDRTAFLEAGQAVLRASGGVAAVVEHLQAKRVRLSDERVFASVNTPADRRALLET